MANHTVKNSNSDRLKFNRSTLSLLVACTFGIGLTGCSDKLSQNTESNPIVASKADNANPSAASQSNQSSANTAKDQSQESFATPEGIEQVVHANNQFALSLYRYINNHPTKSASNVFFSPYSLSTAMAMLYVSAEGETKQQIQDTFHYPVLNILNPNSGELYRRFNTQHDDYKLATTNNLWMQQGLIANKHYTDTVKKYYGGEVKNLNFSSNPEGSRKAINDAIEQQTNNMIVDLLPSGSIANNTVTVLTNSVYFKGDWQMPFQPRNTSTQPFYTFDGGQVDSQLMYQEKSVDYLKNNQAQIIRLPYKGDDLSMLVVLPKEKSKQAMDNLVNGLTVDTLKQWNQGLSRQLLDLYLPTFKLQESYKLKPVLSNMGMPKAFTSNAEFDIFDKTNDINELLYVDDVIHKAVVEVDETGTEAAAATAVTVNAESAKITTEFKADHPFMFVIQDDKTNTILFMGQVNKPSA